MEKKGLPLTLGTEKIRNLLIEYSLPAIVAMVASSLYNITDSIFIGHGVGALAISGLAVTFPFMNLSAALVRWLGRGFNVDVGRLGQKIILLPIAFWETYLY